MDIQTVSLKNYSSLRIGGEGMLVIVKSIEELKEVIVYAKAEGLRVHLLGSGTNSYFGSTLSEYLFIKLDLQGITFYDNHLTAMASEIWDTLVAESVEKGFWGIENLSLIPGTVGAAPVQNIGAYGVELKDVLESVTVLDLINFETSIFTNEMCVFGYRTSLFKKNKNRYCILSVKIKLSKEPKPVLSYKQLDILVGKNPTSKNVRDLVVEIRKAKLPDLEEYPNAGSFFKNPVVSIEEIEKIKNLYPEIPTLEIEGGYKVPAAWLIEHVAQMKGVGHNDIGTWELQPLVVVNYGTATADDIDSLAEKIRSKVLSSTGILLEQEVNRIG